MSVSDDLLRYRSEFPILERTNYMISNSLGAMPSRSSARGSFSRVKCAHTSAAVAALILMSGTLFTKRSFDKTN